MHWDKGTGHQVNSVTRSICKVTDIKIDIMYNILIPWKLQYLATFIPRGKSVCIVV